jgi:hypothetical protein
MNHYLLEVVLVVVNSHYGLVFRRPKLTMSALRAFESPTLELQPKSAVSRLPVFSSRIYVLGKNSP